MASHVPRQVGSRNLGFLLLVLGPVATLEVYTPGAMEVQNGTDVRLKCTFHSVSPVGQKLTISWYFQPQTKEPLEPVFFYNEEAYPPKSGHFLGRLTWDGNVHKGDASVVLHHVSPSDNGTYQCHVKNPPDVGGNVGEIQLSVVLQGKWLGRLLAAHAAGQPLIHPFCLCSVSLSEIHILALTILIACTLMAAGVAVVVIRHHRLRMKQDKKMEVAQPEAVRLKDIREQDETPLPGRQACQS